MEKESASHSSGLSAQSRGSAVAVAITVCGSYGLGEPSTINQLTLTLSMQRAYFKCKQLLLKEIASNETYQLYQPLLDYPQYQHARS